MIVESIKEAWKQKKLALLIYIIQLIIAMGIGIQVFHVMESSIGQSLNLQKILVSFDRTVFEDFVQVHGASITPLLGMMRWWIPVFMLCSIFIHNGLWYNMIHGHHSIKTFLKAGAQFFLRSSLIVSLSWILALLIIGLIWGGFFGIVENPIDYFVSEKPFVHWIFVLIFLSCLVLGILWFMAFSLRFQLIRDELNPIAWRSGFLLFKRFMKWYLFVATGFLLLLGLLFFGFRVIVDIIPSRSWLGLVLVIMLQQFFSLMRIFLRIMFYDLLIQRMIFDRNGQSG